MEIVKGFVAVTDKQGYLKRIIDYKMEIPFKKGEPFTELMDIESKAKASAFLDKIINGNAIFDWEMNVKLEDKIKTLQG